MGQVQDQTPMTEAGVTESMRGEEIGTTEAGPESATEAILMMPGTKVTGTKGMAEDTDMKAQVHGIQRMAEDKGTIAQVPGIKKIEETDMTTLVLHMMTDAIIVIHVEATLHRHKTAIGKAMLLINKTHHTTIDLQ